MNADTEEVLCSAPVKLDDAGDVVATPCTVACPPPSASACTQVEPHAILKEQCTLVESRTLDSFGEKLWQRMAEHHLLHAYIFHGNPAAESLTIHMVEASSPV